MSSDAPHLVPLEETLAFVEPWLAPCSRVLEVGCGDGQLALRLAARGHSVTGIDASAEAVELARRAGFEAACADVLDYAPPAAGFDVVLFTRSLHHVADLERALERARALLRPGGRLIAEEHDVDAVDAPTARWLLDLLDVLAAGDLLAPDGTPPPAGDDVLARWSAAFPRDPDLHAPASMVRAVQRRFALRVHAPAPYLYRYVARRLRADPRGARVARRVLELERARLAAGALAPLGLRLVGEAPGGDARRQGQSSRASKRKPRPSGPAESGVSAQ